MTPYGITIINSIILIAMSAWAYFTAVEPSPTAFIPAAFGLIFLLTSPLFKKGNKAVVHIVVLLTFLLIFALVKPLTAAMGRADTLAIFRVGLMILTSVVATIIYIKSFIDARKNRA